MNFLLLLICFFQNDIKDVSNCIFLGESRVPTVENVKFETLLRNSHHLNAAKEKCCFLGKGGFYYQMIDGVIRKKKSHPKVCLNQYARLRMGIALAVKKGGFNTIKRNEILIDWKKVIVSPISFRDRLHRGKRWFLELIQRGWTPYDPVDEAICTADLVALKFFLEKGFPLNKESECIGKSNSQELNEFLISRGISKQLIFIRSVIWNNQKIFQRYLSKVDVNKPLQTSQIDRALYYGIELMRFNMVTQLLQAGAKITTGKECNGLKLIFSQELIPIELEEISEYYQKIIDQKLYSKKNKIRMLKLLLKYSDLTTINHQNNLYQTVLDNAIKKKEKEIVEILRKHGAKMGNEL